MFRGGVSLIEKIGSTSTNVIRHTDNIKYNDDFVEVVG